MLSKENIQKTLPIFEIRNVNLNYGEKQVLKNIDLKIVNLKYSLESMYLIKQSRIGPIKITRKQSTTKNLNILAIMYMMSNF